MMIEPDLWPAPVEDALLLARSYLSRVAEPASVPMWWFVQSVGPVAAADAIRSGSAPPEVTAVTAARGTHVDEHSDLETAQRHGVRLVVPESPEWPHFGMTALERTGQARVMAYWDGDRARRESGELVPPLALWVKGNGDLAAVGTRSVAVVGARAATAYGEHVTADLAYGAAGRGVTVVSGGAYGIDATAHRSAIAAGGTTVVVSAGGLDRPYPAGNAHLFDQATQNGLLVSESPPGCAPQRHRFLTRNRLIAAFSTGTLVVEAALRSGAGNTVAHAVALSRPIMAVPGPVTSPMSAGCHALLGRDRDRAVLVSCVDDLLAVVGSVDDGMNAKVQQRLPAPDLRIELDALDPVARQVFEALPVRKPASPDELALRSGVTAIEVIRALPVLDLADLIDVSDGGYRIAPRLRPRGRSAHRGT